MTALGSREELEKSSSDLGSLEKPLEGEDEVYGLGDELISELATAGRAVATDGHGRVLLQIDDRAQARLRWKIDWHIMPVVMLMYLWCFIDRVNIGNARLYGLEKDLNMSGNQFNVALTSFYIAYVVLEFPVVLATKFVGPGRWLPFLTFGFGVVSMCTAFVHTFSQLCGVRFCLGIFECGLFPGIAYYLSRWYRKGELVFRLSLYIAMAPLAGAFGGLLAYGIVNDITNIGWLTEWRMLFVRTDRNEWFPSLTDAQLVEGLVTIGVGICSYFLLTDRPASARWLSPEEKALQEARMKADTIAITESLERTRWQTIWAGIANFNVWVIGFIALINSQMVQGFAVFLPTIIATQWPAERAVVKNLLTVPAYFAGFFMVLSISYTSWKTRRHALYVIICAPFAFVGYILFLFGPNTGAKYTGSFLVAMGAFPLGALLNGWIAANVAPDGARASGIAFAAILQNIGGLISSWTYLPQYKPRYVPGHTIGIVSGVLQFVLAALLWAFQVWENKRREAGKRNDRLKGLSASKIALLGHRHPEFRYTY